MSRARPFLVFRAWLVAMACSFTLSAALPVEKADTLGQGCLDKVDGGEIDSLLNLALKSALASNYSHSIQLLGATPLKGLPIAEYFRGVVLLQRHEDLGDTAALKEAMGIWSALQSASGSAAGSKAKSSMGSPSRPPSPIQKAEGEKAYPANLVRGLAGLQWAAGEQILGNHWRSARLSLQAREILKPLQACPEAKAALALFDYYRSTLLSRIPLMGGDSRLPSMRLDSAARNSRRLGPLFRTAWIWMTFDRKEFAEGLKAIDAHLARYPQDRLYLQMRGDFLFHRGDVEASRTTYRQVRDLYASDTLVDREKRLPLGYLSASGNLARIHAALGAKDSALHYLAIWDSPRYRKAQPWLPTSLKKALKPLRKTLNSTSAL